MRKYYFTVMGVTRKSEYFENNELAFKHRCDLERKTQENWKVYDDRGDLVYGVAIIR